MKRTKFIINISGEETEVEVYVNEQGNLMLEGIGLVLYDMIDEELSLTRFHDSIYKKLTFS